MSSQTTTSGFASAAVPQGVPAAGAPVTAPSSPAGHSIWKEIWDKMRSDAYDDFDKYPYERLFFAVHLGLEVFDKGSFIRMSGNPKEPITKAQIERMILSAVEDKKWDKLYLFDQHGEPAPGLGRAVQKVINEMRAAGRLPEGCTISAVTSLEEYPVKSAKAFEKWAKAQWLAGAFNSTAPGGAPGYTTLQQPGYTASASVPAPQPASTP